MVRLPAQFDPHSASLGPATAMRVLSALVPVSPPPTGLDVCFFFIYLVSDFLALRFSVSSGCARSVSTYAAILVLWPAINFSSKVYFINFLLERYDQFMLLSVLYYNTHFPQLSPTLTISFSITVNVKELKKLLIFIVYIEFI